MPVYIRVTMVQDFIDMMTKISLKWYHTIFIIIIIIISIMKVGSAQLEWP